MDQLVNRPGAKKRPPIGLESGTNAGGVTRRRRRWLLAAAVLAIGLAGFAYASRGRPTSSIDYTTVPAETGSITVEVSATGTLRPLIQVDISSELSGVVRSVAVVENQRVAKGEVLAELDTVRLAARVERAEASVAAAQAKVTEARATFDETERALSRTAELARCGMVTEQSLETATAMRDRASANVAIALSNLAVADAELKLEQADVSKSTIYAPIDGTVTSGGFTITRSSNGSPIAVNGSATLLGPSGRPVTVTIVSVKLLGVWIGATTVSDPVARVNVVAGTLSRNGITTVGSDGATGTFTAAGPARTVTWTVRDLV